MLLVRPSQSARGSCNRLRSRDTWPGPCLTSLVVHLALVAALALWGPFRPPGGPAVATLVSISLEGADQPEDYYAETSESQPSQEQAVEVSNGSPLDPLDLPPPLDPSAALPPAADLGDQAVLGSDQPTGAGGFLDGPRQSGSLAGGKARLSVFGVSGDGYKFVFVFDRSGSMGGSGNSPLAAAKAELKASLAQLSEIHQFQIIFYNERPLLFPLAGQTGRLVFGTKVNKQSAYRFIDSVTADGATRHEEALLAALKLAPDVIFFLTDADQPELSSRQLANISKRNYGAAINAIEFGLGPSFRDENFLVRLARENGGAYTYFDVSRLRASR